MHILRVSHLALHLYQLDSIHDQHKLPCSTDGEVYCGIFNVCEIYRLVGSNEGQRSNSLAPSKNLCMIPTGHPMAQW